MNKTWNTNVVGVLASDESVQHAFGTKAIMKTEQNILQFYVRMISKVPNSFPSIRLIPFFSTDLEKWGFEDRDFEEEEGKRAITEFLAENLIVFKPQRKVLSDGLEVYDGKDLMLIPKSEEYHEGVHLTPIPIFSEEEHGISQLDFELRLQTGQFVGNIDSISHEQKDTPQYVLWKTSEFDYTIYGEFTGHRYGDDGFSFTTSKRIKGASFGENWLDDSYEYEHTMFVTHEIYTYMDEVMLKAKPLDNFYQKVPMLEGTERQLAAASVAPVEEYPNGVSRMGLLEEELMEEFIRTTRVQRLLYDVKDLYNFHTAMKSSNLVILAGMSGTGKSKLVKAYGQALGLKNEQLTIIPVRSAWTDDVDLIGYADTLNHVYRPGDSGVVNALLSAEENPNKLHIICLDEMNLARVEHYFSQFLSVLEMESGPDRVLRLYNDNLKETLKNSDDYPPAVLIGDNVIFVGTVNLDESTYHFSDKVLDRANVITLNVLPFPSLKLLTEEVRNPVEKKEGTISFDLFESFWNKDQDLYMRERELALLWDIHTELQNINKHIGVGPRIVRQIDMYLKNLPENNVYTREEAFDKQIVQRILTKVRGPEEQLKRFIGVYNKQTENVEDSRLIDILDRYDEVSEFYETRNILIHKAKELKLNGYTL